VSRLASALLGLAALCGTAAAESLVSTLSDDAVEITSNFAGEQIVVFGAIRDGSEDDPDYQIAVVVEGPSQDVVVRRRQRFLGVWLNLAAREFESVPSYYVMHLSENLAAADPAALAQYRLGLESLPFVREAAADPGTTRFAEALIELRSAGALYAERGDAITFLAPNVFRTTFFLPSDVPTGDYRVSVYLFRNEGFLAGATETLRVEKGGFSQRIAEAADQQALPYGLVCVALALFTGWFAGVIFRRP
jgi:uncharacterized protein (TIGR02186 family)